MILIVVWPPFYNYETLYASRQALQGFHQTELLIGIFNLFSPYFDCDNRCFVQAPPGIGTLE